MEDVLLFHFEMVTSLLSLFSLNASPPISSQSLETALKYCNYFFTSTFVVEATLKLIAFGFRRFFKDRYGCPLCETLTRRLQVHTYTLAHMQF